MTRYTCLECGRLTSASYCPQHEQEATQRRLQAVAMRYGRRHELRRQAAVGSGGAWETLRRRTAAAQAGICALCGWPLGERFEVDHIVPIHRGGTSAPENLRALHPECHRAITERDEGGRGKVSRSGFRSAPGAPIFGADSMTSERQHEGAGG